MFECGDHEFTEFGIGAGDACEQGVLCTVAESMHHGPRRDDGDVPVAGEASDRGHAVVTRWPQEHVGRTLPHHVYGHQRAFPIRTLGIPIAHFYSIILQ